MMNHVETARERRRGRFRCYSSLLLLFIESHLRLLFIAPWNFRYDDFKEISNLVTNPSHPVFRSRLVMAN